MGVQLVADPVNRRVRSLADQGFQVLGGLLGSLGFCDQQQVLLLQSVDLLCVAADLDVVTGGQLFELVDGLLEGLEDLVELNHAGLSSGGKTERRTMRVRLVGLAGWDTMPLQPR